MTRRLNKAHIGMLIKHGKDSSKTNRNIHPSTLLNAKKNQRFGCIQNQAI